MTVVVLPPTLDRGVIEDGTGVMATSVDARGGSPITKVDGLRCILIPAANSDLSCIVSAPTLHNTIVEQGAGVLMTKSNRDGI